MSLFPLYGHGYCVSVLHLGLPYSFRQALSFYIIGHASFDEKNEHLHTLPETNSSHLKIDFPKRKLLLSNHSNQICTVPSFHTNQNSTYTHTHSLHPWNPPQTPTCHMTAKVCRAGPEDISKLLLEKTPLPHPYYPIYGEFATGEPMILVTIFPPVLHG